ncbi:DUF5610 domain-containing protein [Salinimonas sp. HHU 13199]|uniref:DUF5610 domain-containing protein n=1 Tax=Salinimonas profundi TaxID=2729140 RepID=A0ABR8LK24_9ALTE|nr:DUF5610 domain-containing protein [Salinimonas profundi]MBD3586548.1 DUF5610 domain-containing protein [Salinimonas profundi]
MQTVAASSNFGQQVHQLKASRADEGATGSLGKDVSAMAHARNAERQAEKNPTSAADQVDLTITDSTNTDGAVTAIVTHNINEALQASEESTGTTVALRQAKEGKSLSDVLRSGFSSLLTGYQQQNPEQSPEEALNSFTTLMQDGVEKGFIEAQDALANGSVLDEESVNQLMTSKDDIQALINHLAAAVSESA